MRIALFSGNYNYVREGANLALNKLVGFLEEDAGATVRVYSPVTATPAFEPTGTLVPVPSVTLPLRNEFRLALRLPRAIRDDLRDFGPDLVHVSTPDILGCRAQSYAENAGLPIVASMHTRFETYLEYYRLSSLRPLLEWHLRRFYRRADHVVAPTAELVRDLEAVLGDNKASVWSRGVDKAMFNPQRRNPAWRRAQGIGQDETVVLFLGRLVAEKGIDIYVAVMRELSARGIKVRPLIVGAGPAESQFDVLPRAIMTGHLSGTQLAEAIASADVLLNPSTTETFGNVILETMASGVPVVGADAQNTRSILTDGVDGIICPPRDVVAYVEAITALCCSQGYRDGLAAQALRTSARYDWANCSRAVATVYERLLCRQTQS